MVAYYFDQNKQCLEGVQFNNASSWVAKSQTAPCRQSRELSPQSLSRRWNRRKMEIDKDNDRMMNGVIV